jgi:ABC-2 type transport system permease protein
MIKKKYQTLCKISMQNAIAYRSNFIINISASLFAVTSLFFLWHAIYGDRSELNGYTWDQMKAYLLITFITNTLLSWYSETAISKKILDGSVAMDLLKPIDFQKARLAETIGSSIFESLIGITMACIILLIFSGILLPSTFLSWVLFILSLLISVLTKFSIVYIAGLFCFWTTHPFGIAWARAAITNFFSGALVPFAFFPDWMEKIALALPFKGIVYIPASVYLGQLQGLVAVKAIFFQIIWLVLLWIIGKLLWTWAIRQVTIYGG